jgi:hypothetical protein
MFKGVEKATRGNDVIATSAKARLQPLFGSLEGGIMLYLGMISIKN